MSDGQPEVRNDTTPVRPDQDILGLDIPMCDGGLALGPEDLCVEVDESRNGGDEDAHRIQLRQRRPVPQYRILIFLNLLGRIISITAVVTAALCL